MFVRVKKTGPYQYLQIVQNNREGNKIKQRIIGSLGRVDHLSNTSEIEGLIHKLSRFTNQATLVLNAFSQVNAEAISIGPALIFERIWKDLGLGEIIDELAKTTKHEFSIERAVFLTVLHRLISSGSDRSCEKWKEVYSIGGSEEIALQHLYRSMHFLGKELEDQQDHTPFSPRCIKDVIEEKLFDRRKDLFSGLDLVFFDTTSIYFEGLGGDTLGNLGHSKDHRPDLNQMIVGAVINSTGEPICCELWPGNTADVNTLLPITDRIRKRFGVTSFCIVADRGMISNSTIEGLEQRAISYILGVRMRQRKPLAKSILSRAGRYKEVQPEGSYSKDPSPLKVKEVWLEGTRYINCLNEKQARKDIADREAILESLEEKVHSNPRSLVGNKGYKKYLHIDKDSFTINHQKIQEEARYDGKWILQTNTDLPAAEVALKYKELWQVERVFRDVKSILETRPVYHQVDENIRGHVFCSFLALVLRKELDNRLQKAGMNFEWDDIKRDLTALQEVTVQESDVSFTIRTQSRGVCGKVFQATGVAMPPTIKQNN